MINRNHKIITKHNNWLTGRINRVLATGLLLLWFTIGLVSWAEAVTPGTLMINRVSVHSATQNLSGTATVKAIERTPSQLDFFAYAPNSTVAEQLYVSATLFSSDATATGNFLSQVPPQVVGAETPITLDQPLPLLATSVLHAGNPLFMRLTDLDQNLYPTIRENVLVLVHAPNGDKELLELNETDPDTGIFTGYLITANQGTAPVEGDGLMDLKNIHQVDGFYFDPIDGSDSSAAGALIDPLGRVFDSSSGEMINGATITLLNDDGSEATVFGDDGFSSYPATVISGGTVTDSSGSVYRFDEGEYRFPFISQGRYQLRVVPPSGYGVPSTVPYEQLQTLPGAPYAIVDGSKGELFNLGGEPILYIDIPVDPANGLWLQKSAARGTVSVGDFLQYKLKLESNSDTAVFQSVAIVDYLPLGFRYQKGSTYNHNQHIEDPSESSDGRTLTFNIGTVDATTSPEIGYVVEVAAGSSTGKAVNRAQASDAHDNLSNQASAEVTVKEEFFRNKVFLVGKVIESSCSATATEQQGIQNARIYLEDGTFVDSDQNGMFHFEGIDPGVHVVQLDLGSLPLGYEAIPCEQSSQFAGRTFSQFVDLKGGTLWRTNFYVQPLPDPKGEVSLNMSGKLNKEGIDYRLELDTAKVPVSNMVLNLMLPSNATLLPGSAQLDKQPLLSAECTDSNISFKLGSRPANWSGVLTFKAEIDSSLASGELSSKSLLLFDTSATANQQTPIAEVLHRVNEQIETNREELNLYPRFPTFVATLQDNDLLMLDRIIQELSDQEIARITVVGHTDNVPISVESRHIFADNLALSKARAESVASYLAEHLQISSDKLNVRGAGELIPVADNRTESGRALNRRVDLVIETEQSERTVQLETVRESSGTLVASTTGLPKGVTAPTAGHRSEEDTTTSPKEQPSGILKPTEGSLLPHSLNQIIIRIDKRLTPKIFLDEQEVSKEAIGARITEGSQTIYSYIGVDFGEVGSRTLRVTGVDTFGNNRFEQSIDVIRTDQIATIRLVSNDGNFADGRTPVSIRIKLLDHAGNIIPAASQLELRSEGLSPLGENNQKEERKTNRVTNRTIQVDANGLVQFEPVNKAGSYQVSLSYNDAELKTDIFVKPQMRDWMLVGFAQGTVGYNTLSDNKVSARDAGIDENEYTDGQIKFFAKGAIKGEWLLTLAYDSDKLDLDSDSLHQIINPDTYYPLYGDETQQGYEASSAEKLFVKLERDQFYALFGDMQTGLSQTVLSQYSRNMNGFKSEMQDERFAYTVFAAETRQSFKKDEIRGDGTAGRYYLSQNDLVINSEEVVIETRDRFHNELIVKEERLSRYADYDIDFDAGTLYFKRPVSSKDQDFNPVFIVVRYETKDSSNTNLNYGGRAAVKLLDQQIEVGGSLIHEENGAETGDLYGADATVNLTPQTTLHVEAATSEVESIDEDDSKGDAYLVEVEHLGKNFDLRTWFRQQDGEFGLGQQNGGTEGMRTYGAQGNYRLNSKWSLSGEAYHEDNLGTDATRDVESMQAQYQTERYGLSAGVREARDQFEDGEKQTSRQMLAGANWSTPDRKLTLRTTHEQSLGSNDKNSDYPTRTMLGADYQLTRNISLFAEQEFTWGEQEDTEGTRVGLKAAPWKGGEVRTAVERQSIENAERVFALFGVGQIWQVTQRWSMDLSIDRSYTVKNEPAGERVNGNVPAASGGDDDFTAVSVGAAYRTAKWSWWNRLETRQGDNEDKVGISSGVVGDIQEGVAVSARLLAFINKSKGGSDSDEEEITLGLAYRPNRSNWILLERLDVSLYNESGNGTDNDSMRIVNHLHANFRSANRKWQISYYYGLKYVRENFGGDRYSGYTDMVSIEARYNINKKWDIGVHGALLHSWNSDQFDYSLGSDIGYSPMTNAWLSVGYNLVGFEDEDFSDANYTAEGAYVRFRAKFDQQSVREAAEWLNR